MGYLNSKSFIALPLYCFSKLVTIYEDLSYMQESNVFLKESLSLL